MSEGKKPVDRDAITRKAREHRYGGANKRNRAQRMREMNQNKRNQRNAMHRNNTDTDAQKHESSTDTIDLDECSDVDHGANSMDIDITDNVSTHNVSTDSRLKQKQQSMALARTKGKLKKTKSALSLHKARAQRSKQSREQLLADRKSDRKAIKGLSATTIRTAANNLAELLQEHEGTFTEHEVTALNGLSDAIRIKMNDHHRKAMSPTVRPRTVQQYIMNDVRDFEEKIENRLSRFELSIYNLSL